ncbi:peptidylprolyl isomerase [Lewinella sp. W8]|uniref:peptidylprolyl isomerase n=1 Tax=Lewinella sp. W8 TaxID=2528208 RepID=UPI0015633A1E|nr:peptidylprolyl isomerase [Lewinella sp. W8]
MIKHFILLAIFLVGGTTLTGQKDSDILFTVAGEPVTVEEFTYIYAKTNGDDADFSESSIKEYLDLYQRFKLKVVRAKSMGLDTVAALQQELAGYRRQLADNYLVNRQVTDRLIQELHEHQQQDIEIQHILFQFRGNPRPEDTLRLFKLANSVRQTVTIDNFAEKAQQYSQDKYSKDKGGKIGFVTAPFPKGLHNLEAALYEAPVNTVVGPIRTEAGYHLAAKTASRPARGEIEAAHIMVRKPESGDPASVIGKINKAKLLLDDGTDFGQVAATFSEDDKTKDNDGYIGFFGINRYERAIEDAAFALEADGDYSDVVESKVGYHIIKRISRKGIQPLNDVRALLESKIKADGRFADAEQRMLNKIRTGDNVTENKAAFGRYAATLVDSTFFNFRWTPMAVKGEVSLLKIEDDFNRTLTDFQEYLTKNTRKRVGMGRTMNAYSVANNLYESWIEEQLMEYAESRLEKDYPEFRALMREYREGILLFEATKMEVWDRASEDTLGLQQFFEEHREDYRWGERAEITSYVVSTAGGLDPKSVYEYARTHGPDATQDEFGRASMEVTTRPYELNRMVEFEGLEAKKGSLTKLTNDLRKNQATFHKVERLLPPRNKELREARGYVIADFQDALEKQWVENLRKQYPIKVNKKALAKLIKS